MDAVKRCVCQGMGCKLCNRTGVESCAICGGGGTVLERDEHEEHVYHPIPCPSPVHGRKQVEPRIIIQPGFAEKMSTYTFANLRFDHPKLHQAAEALQKILTDKRGWLVLYGPPGRGKTYLLGCGLNALKDYAIPTGRYGMASSILDELNAATLHHHSRGVTFDALKRELIGLGYLALDEMMEFPHTDWRMGTLREVLSSRSDNAGFLPTVFATNSPGDEISRLMPWLTSRFDHPLVVEMDMSDVPALRKQMVTL